MNNLVKVMVQKQKPKATVIIPSLDGYRGGNVPKLLEALKNQTFQGSEVIVVKGESPCARAHNVGAQRARGDILVFLDDDVRLGNDRVIKNLITPFLDAQRTTHDSQPIGLTGASQLIPPDANAFQKKCAREFGRFQFPVVSEMVESDMVTHAAMAIRKQVFNQVGQENENLIYGDDPDLRARIRQAGYKIVIVPNTWVYHPPPPNLSTFLRTAFQRGKGAAHDFWHYPDLIYETPPATATTFVPRRTFLYRIYRFIGQNLKAILNLKVIFLSVRLSYGLGYVLGLLREMILPTPNGARTPRWTSGDLTYLVKKNSKK